MSGSPRLQLRLDGRTPSDRRILSIKGGVKATAAVAHSAKAPTTALPIRRGSARGGDNSGLVEVSLGQTRSVRIAPSLRTDGAKGLRCDGAEVPSLLTPL